MRERGLGDVQLLGRTREVTVASHRLDGAQLPHVHASDQNTIASVRTMYCAGSTSTPSLS